MRLTDFKEIWCVEFDYEQDLGEAPTPFSLTAKEFHSGRAIQCEQRGLAEPPYALGQDILFVAYDAAVPLGCHLALNWPMPARVLDLHAEFRCSTSGLDVPGNFAVEDALTHFGLAGDGVGTVEKLLAVMEPGLDLPRALLRGRYMAAVARMEAVGVPIDVASHARLREGWESIQSALIGRVDNAYGVFRGRKFDARLWAAWVNRRGIPWPRLNAGRLNLSLDAFRDMAEAYPEVRPMKELRATLALLRPAELPVGRDGRNRTSLRPFAAKTGRNAPSTTKFMFGPAVWLRGLIKPKPGMAVAYVDYEQQEFGIAAALSKDQAMVKAYLTGDPYLEFAKQAGAVPEDATKQSHQSEREKFKHCALGVQYGMGAKSLGIRLGVSLDQARGLLRLHKRTYPTYWRWSKAVEKRALRDGKLQAAFGWTVNVGAKPNRRSLRNFPLQANGAEMLRLACCFLTEEGVRVCAPVHDALLVEAPAEGIEEAVARCQQAMQRASEYVLLGFALRTEAKVLSFPDRFMDPRGTAMWKTVFELLDGVEVARSA